MKRIIIPAGTVSAKKDYILEIPAEAADKANEEAIYILDDRGSRASFRSLSDYFYEDTENYNPQDYEVESPSPQKSQIYQNRSPSRRVPSGSYYLRPDYKYERYSQYSNSPMDSNAYGGQLSYRSLPRNTGSNRTTPFNRKFMKFNKLAVSDFLSNTEAQKPIDHMANPNNLPPHNASVGTYDNMVSAETSAYDIDQAGYPQPQKYVAYYETYPNQANSNLDANMYQQVPSRANTQPLGPNIYSKPTTSQVNYAYVTRPSRNQQFYNSRYYPKSPSALVVNRQGYSTENVRYVSSRQYEMANINSNQQYADMRRTSSIMKSKTSDNFKQPIKKEEELRPQNRRMIRTLPGTSLVSNVPNQRISPEYSSNM